MISTWRVWVWSEEYGHDFVGPYDSLDDAREGMSRLRESAAELNDGVTRRYAMEQEPMP